MLVASSVHIAMTLTCENCGNDFDVEDYDSMSVEDACDNADDKFTCPVCGDDS